MHPTLILHAAHYMHEDGAEGDVPLVEPVIQEEEDALLSLKGGGMVQLGVAEDLTRDLPRE
eukprot:5636121-Alexandrium_andersonii.AAC.1